jgi:chemotaxis protein MotB
MARSGKQIEEDETPGAPEWMVTFSDCMTLLLTFFVLLLSFSSFDDKVFRKLQMIFMEALPAISKSNARAKEAIVPPEQIQITVDLLQGSEKPTLDRGLKNGLVKETFVDFRGRKVFSISSEKIFWGNGVLMSDEGRAILDDVALFLEAVPSRVVVCESGPSTGGVPESVGLSRAWAVIEFLTSGRDIEKSLFTVSAGNALVPKPFAGNDSAGAGSKSERTLEIAVLERSI